MRYLRKMAYRPGPKFSVPFFVTLGILTVVSFLIPLRPQRSYAEKRDLARFPEFSFSALVSGDYFDGISLWFSDTFPGREQWITLAQYDDSLYGYSDIYIQGEIPVTETVPVILENPTPATSPTQSTVTTQSVKESVPPVTEPVTEPSWGGVDAGDAAEIIRDMTAFQIGDSAFIYQNFSQATSDSYAAVVNELAQKLQDKGVTVISAPTPTAVGVLIEDEYQQKLGSVSQVKIQEYINSRLDPQVVAVDTVNALIDHNDEYIYFRTDHHWTALGAYYSYRAICESVGLEPVDIETLEPWDQGTFRGSLYGRVQQPNKLRADTVTAYIPKGDIRFETYNTDGFPSQRTILTDASNRTEYEKYLVFGTDYPMTHAENRSLPDAPNCIVVKDSFGNCFVPFLTQNFHHVYAIDYRKYYNEPIDKLIEKYNIDCVIIMPYITAVQDSQGPEMFRRVCLSRW